MNPKVAYFSAEIGLDESIPVYSGGLGILAGDTIKAMADLHVPLCAVTLLYKYGNFNQKIIDKRQQEEYETWDYKSILEDTKKEVVVNISGEDVRIRIWKYEYEGVTQHKIPIYFLDTNLEENSKWAQEVTDKVYIGDRIAQEIVLGIGGIRALTALGFGIEKYHMNEGHSVFLTLELFKTLGMKNGWEDGQVKSKCVFTTHTPVPAGHDKFSYEDIYDKLKGEEAIIPIHIRKLAGDEEFNTTKLALSFSHYTNAVSIKHAEITREMFPDFTISAITNGIHTKSWTCEFLSKLYDRWIPGWEKDASFLKRIFIVPNSELFETHLEAKRDFINYVNENSIIDVKLDPNVLTIGYARRFAAYKQADFIFKNLDNLRRLGKKVQFVFAGKAHSKDGLGKDILTRVLNFAEELKDDVSIAFLENYDMNIAKKMTSGVDLWLNTPIPYNEASGTSGMKAAANGVLHLSRLDGWAIEGFERNGGGFPIEEYCDFISKLEYKIIPMYYSKNKAAWIEEMKLAIGNAASYFNTHRMAKDYLDKAYNIKVERGNY